jgi:hypothetical protein
VRSAPRGSRLLRQRKIAWNSNNPTTSKPKGDLAIRAIFEPLLASGCAMQMQSCTCSCILHAHPILRDTYVGCSTQCVQGGTPAQPSRRCFPPPAAHTCASSATPAAARRRARRRRRERHRSWTPASAFPCTGVPRCARTAHLESLGQGESPQRRGGAQPDGSTRRRGRLCTGKALPVALRGATSVIIRTSG